MFHDLLINLLANLAWVLLGATATGLVALVTVIMPGQRRKRRMARFFGVNMEHSTLTTYLSNLIIPPNEQFPPPATFRYHPRDGKVVVGGYRGSAVPSPELSVVNHIVAAIQQEPLQDLPKSLRDMLAKRWKSFRPIKLSFVVSPDRPIPHHGWRFESLITIGSGVYNSVSDYYSGRFTSRLRIQGNPYFILVTDGEHQGKQIFPSDPAAPGGLAVLEKLIDVENNTIVFIAAGAGILGSLGAVQYLVHEWDSLQSLFGDDPFSLALEFEIDKSPSMDELHPSSIHKF